MQRQHRSFDGADVLGESELSDWPVLQPLNVLTSSANPSSMRVSGGPLSNPTTSNAQFWRQTQNAVPQRKVGYYSTDDVQLTHEYEILKREYENAVHKLNSTMNSIKTFWSPELKRERQLRKEESAKLANLQAQLSRTAISDPFSTDYRVTELERELENTRYEVIKKEETIRRMLERSVVDTRRDGASGSRMAELETRCNQLESLVAIRDQQLRAMEQRITQHPYSSTQRDAAKDRRIVELEEENAQLRNRGIDAPRDFTDKSVTTHELHTLRMKMERSEMELAQTCSKLAATQNRLQALGEENDDLRRHLGVLRDASNAKEQHSTLLQSDIEALRTKLEAKNLQIEQKEKVCERLDAELTLTKGQLADLRETNKSSEQRMNQLVARLDALEAMLRDKEAELERTKQKLLAQPDIQMERQLELRIEEAYREKASLQSLIDDLRRNAEKEKAQQLETFQEQHRQLSATIESLQKELTDRQILLESQNQKIGDLDRELCSAEKMRRDQMPLQTNDEQLAEARREVESLLRMVQSLEKEKASLISQCKQLQGVDDAHRDGHHDTGSHRTDSLKGMGNGNLKNRVEELEEALRESVSITAERELHVAQQKQLNQQLVLQLSESRREICELRKCLKELSTVGREDMVRSFEEERRRHIDQLLQLKHEALVAAIAEKDAHIDLLEQSRERPRDEIETLRRHKEKLMEKLKEENERRAQFLSTSGASVTPGVPHMSSLTAGSIAPGAPLSVQLTKKASLSLEQEDDAEGIWA